MTSAVPEKIVNLLLDVRGCYVTSGPRVIVLRPDITFSNAGAEEPTPHCKHDKPETERTPFPADKTTEEELDPEGERHSPLSLRPRALVGTLFLGSRPSAIARFVVAVVVDAVKGCPNGTWPHIGKEVLKGVPAFADRDSSASIAVEVGSSWVGAALVHIVPDDVLTAPSPLAGMAMLSGVGSVEPHPVDTKAATTTGVALCQVAARDDDVGTAFAVTEPGDTPTDPPLWLDGRKAAELLAGEIGRSGRNLGSLFVHLEALLSGVMRTAVPPARPLLFYPKEPRYA